MDMYRIENVVCPPFRTATLVDNETIEGQIGEGCKPRGVFSSLLLCIDFLKSRPNISLFKLVEVQEQVVDTFLCWMINTKSQ